MTELYAQNVIPGVAYVKTKQTQTRPTAFQNKKHEFESHSFIRSTAQLKKTSKSGREKPSILDGIYRITFDPLLPVDSICEVLSANDDFLYVEPMYKENLLIIPNDPQAQQNAGQEYLEVIGAYEAWDIQQGDPNVVIGIVDTGLDLEHEDISAKVFLNQDEIPENGIDDDSNGYVDDYLGYDFADNDQLPQAENSYHGNRVGGVAGADTDNGIGIAGIGWNSSIGALKAFKTTDNVSSGTYEAIVYAADNDYDVINLSWGSINSFSQVNQDIINYAVLEKDVVVIAAAGNTNEDLKFYPASYDNVLSVTASNLDDSKASFSTFNYSVDLMAPGTDILSTFNNNAYASDNGTSYSAPMVAGTAALVRAQFPDLNALQVMELIRVNSDPVYDLSNNTDFQDQLGFGRLNMLNTLSRNKNQSIRVSEYEAEGEFEGFLFFDDTITLSSSFKNFLNPVNQVSITISTESEFVDFLENPIEISGLSTLEELIVSPKMHLSESTPANEPISLKLSFSGEDYSDFQYLELQTSPNHLTTSTENISLTIAGNGNLGFANDGFQDGNGLVYKELQVLQNIGIGIVQPSGYIADNWPLEIDGNIRSRDFLTHRNIKWLNQKGTNFTSFSIFTDEVSTSPLGLRISQKSHVFKGDSLENGLILEYRITNQSTDTITDLSIGLYANWDLASSGSNYSYLDQEALILKAFTSDSTLFGGIKIYKETIPIAQSIDIVEQNLSTLTDSAKITLLTTELTDSAGFSSNGTNILQVIAGQPATIPPKSDVRISFLLGLHETETGLDSLFFNLENSYAEILQSPPVYKQFVSCEGAGQSIVPETDEVFRFYSDPLSQNLITENDTLEISGITSDTLFYAQRVDSTYLDELVTIEINVTEEVANFSSSTDTLYLDHPTTNPVSFTDQSFLPISWSWDFGNGVQASVQNPTVNFRDAGSYSVSLSVQNEFGCQGSYSKTIIVTERPMSPDLNDINTCIDSLVSIETSSNDSLVMYRNNTDPQVLMSGRRIALDAFNSDTSFYFSKIENGFESLRKKVVIKIDKIEALYSFKPFISDTSNLLLESNTPNTSIVSWNMLDSIFLNDSVILNVMADSLTFELNVSNETGCKDKLSDTLYFQASPEPVIDFNQPCVGEDLTITPQNGSFFGFYSEESLINLIQVAESIKVENVINDTAIYVVGLDSILPSNPVEIEIEPILFKPSIEASPEQLILVEDRTVTFSAIEQNILSFEWYLNQELVEIVSSPLLLFTDTGSYEVVLKAISSDGCVGYDTLHYEVLEDHPLETKKVEEISIFPNPSKGTLNIKSLRGGMHIVVYDLVGKIVTEVSISSSEYVLNGLPKGSYFIQVITSGGIYHQLQLIR